MPSARGWAVAATGVALLSGGRLLGAGALDQLGFGLLVLVALAVGVVRLGNHEVGARRTVTPARAHAGEPVSVTIEVTNRGRTAAPLVLLHDLLPPGMAGRARFGIQGIESGGRRNASYEVRPPRRGLFEIGPLDVSYVDPFRLAGVSGAAAPATSLLVRPRSERIALPRDSGSTRSMTASPIRHMAVAPGEDFYTLREYVEGDDLRKIHWPSTARLGRTMIRQEQAPWRTRATVLVDDRRPQGDGGAAAFERSVEAAASAVDMLHRSGFTYRLAASHDPGVATGRGPAHHGRCLDFLAVIDTAPPGEHDALARRLTELEGGAAAEGILVAIASSLTAGDAAILSRCRHRFRDVVVILTPVHRFGAAPARDRWEAEGAVVDTVTLLGRTGARVAVVGPHEPLAPAWQSLWGVAARGL